MSSFLFEKYHAYVKYMGIIIGLIVSILLVKFSINFNTQPDNITQSICHEMAEKNKKDYATTEFKDMDFYKSCIDNVIYTSPLSRQEEKITH